MCSWHAHYKNFFQTRQVLDDMEEVIEVTSDSSIDTLNSLSDSSWSSRKNPYVSRQRTPYSTRRLRPDTRLVPTQGRALSQRQAHLSRHRQAEQT
jgi:hypothetical protein